MIKLTDHLANYNVKTPWRRLKLAADIYWNSLNPEKLGVYDETALISVVMSFRDKSKLLDPAYVKGYAGNDDKVALLHSKFFDYFLANNCKILRAIIVSGPKNLDNIKNDIDAKFSSDIFFTKTTNGEKQTNFGKLLSETIFNYKAYRGSKFCIDLLDAIIQPDTFCPYCGYYPIEVVKVDPAAPKVTKKALLDLDHFFSKANYPYFATSVFNLIPCCPICNSRYKLTKKFSLSTHINPYCDSFDRYFSFELGIDAHGKKIVTLNEKTVAGKSKASSDFGLAGRYERSKSLLKLEGKYRGLKRHGLTDLKYAIGALLEDVPLTSKRIMCESHGKAKRDILKHLDSGEKLLASRLV